MTLEAKLERSTNRVEKATKDILHKIGDSPATRDQKIRDTRAVPLLEAEAALMKGWSSLQRQLKVATKPAALRKAAVR